MRKYDEPGDGGGIVAEREVAGRRGTSGDAQPLIGLFDKYKPFKTVRVAPHLHD